MRIVIKIGTSTLAYATGMLNVRRAEELTKVIADLKNAGNEMIIVSSGAIGMGVGKLSLGERPGDIPTKQAAAAVGQCELMYTYDKLFSEYNHTVAQILLTSSDIEDGEKRTNFHNTMSRLLELGVLPIINENDTVATEELGIGDNDTLSAVVAATVDADILILLTDIDGFYTGDPHKDKDSKLIAVIDELTPEMWTLASGTDSGFGTGGMKTKLTAAEIVTTRGIDMVIANGARPENLYDVVEGKPVGTRFTGRKTK